ncbi:phosphoethanolamine transferase [uncultured Polaribacter sp.]|uniref:phosphoethanolamine transferase n=1 Tax=uncultured Polaribacter sp. TaxID=174711 RepID=UPI002639D515|nr:phosphoethanolamine transferase [uncultured Polaribacter sp.]
MEKLKFWLPEIKFHLGLHILIAVFITIASYVHFPFGSLKGNLVYVAHFLLLHFSLFGFIYVFSLFQKLFKIVFPILFILVSSFSFWVYTQDLTIAEGMIQAIVETNTDIAIDVISYQFVLFLLFSTVSILVFFKRFKNNRISSVKSPLFILSIIGVLSFFVVENYKFDAFKNRLPYNVYFAGVKYLKKPKITLKEVKENVFTKEEDLHIVLVVGESVRADHLSLNGYYRNTTPLLSKVKNVISFKKVYTPFTFTAQSVPQILTDKSVDDQQKQQVATSIYTVLNKASFKTEWIGNQSIESSYKDVIYSNKTNLIIDKLHSFQSFKKEKDLALLDYFSVDNALANNRITTLHMIGSHWYYNSRITPEFQHFKPIITSKYIGSLTKEELINSYDNTILYLDNFLNQLILNLKKSSKKTILIYLSDHGETLGEDGRWLHAQEHKATKNPAMLVWFSNHFQKNYPLKIQKLKLKRQDSITTDFLFHSVLDIGNVENYKYLKAQSIFN